LNPDHGAGCGPHLFEVEKLSLEGGKDVHYDISVIEEYPTGIGCTLPMKKALALFF